MGRIGMYCVLTALLVYVPAPAADETANAERVSSLIGKLGSENFGERERAKVELEKLGPAALEHLRKATTSEDLEIRSRAADLVRRIDEAIANRNSLAPKQVHLKLKDVTVMDAIAELQKQSGYSIQVTGDTTFLGSRRITLDTGATSFWQAFDQLCTTGGLVEQGKRGATEAVPTPAPLPAIRKGIRLVPQALPVAPKLPVNNPALQLQPVPAAPAQIQFIGGTRTTTVNKGIVVADGTPKYTPTYYSGAVRVRLLPPTVQQRQKLQAGEMAVVLEVDAEPRLQNFTIAATPQVDRAIDEHGQPLELLMDQQDTPVNASTLIRSRYYLAQMPIRQQAVIRLKQGEKPSRMLREFTGTVATQAVSASTEPVVVIKNVLKAAGHIERSNGHSMQINSITKLDNGDVRIDVSLEGNANVQGIQVIPGGVQQIQVQVGGNVVVTSSSLNAAMPTLLDAKGQSFRLSQMPSRRINNINGQVSSQMTLVYSPMPGQGEADRLVLNGQRQVTLDVPFTFKDVAVE